MNLHTSWDSPVVEARIADSDWIKAPAPLWDRPGFGGAGVTEALSTGATVVLGVVGLEFFTAFMAFLQQTGQMKRCEFKTNWNCKKHNTAGKINIYYMAFLKILYHLGLTNLLKPRYSCSFFFSFTQDKTLRVLYSSEFWQRTKMRELGFQ